ncbi:WcaI family glycosyltransferase [Marivivens donghaensis]|uniref:WcaI family glycosyltransferase n=1 Tax=Marivivens donghaensis TaxID=1699413 RepID=A0ABX0W0Z5_9RHOB|nr:WcaI family glycosyltransferase [Marivivens donghaensis]NIY73949.1 WcaI family glycosyltransferase [Marivivens donghaensis]
MKIQLIGINYSPEIISTAVYSTGLAEQFASFGHKVEVITAQPYYPEWKVKDGWPKYSYRSETSASGVSVLHCPLYVPAEPTGKKRIIHHLSFAFTALPVALWKAVRFQPDVVFVVAPSLLSGPVGFLAAKAGRAQSWLHIQDFEVEAAFATGLIRETSRLGKIAKAFESWTLKRFDRISTISKPMIQKLHEKNVPHGRIYELRNWANLSRVQPIEGVSPLKAELGIETDYVILYSGNLANKQGLEIIPEVARLLAHRSDVTIAVCGEGPMKAKLQEMSAGLDTIRFFPLQPLERLSDLLGMADVHLLPQIADAADLVLPSKLTNMLASGRPTVATTFPGTALGEEVEGCGIVVPPGDATSTASAIENLLDDAPLRSELGENARQRALIAWDGEAILGRLKNEFDKLIANKTSNDLTKEQIN